ncbi:uncharacterized protein LOC108845754 [Raphanus sativus]|uniref:Uncharacterized protein LOC108845754 n=1 Tax=Raphanus sativus TaxID=3726 RepID=A0A9W3C2G6_RAPSA|nr:uncharacterized protein LOC108845754 [Raphanus sativus]
MGTIFRVTKFLFSLGQDLVAVRVRHQVGKAESDIYPQWDDDKVDDDLHSLILDIIHEQLDDKHWSLKAANEPVANKKKRDLVSEEDDCMKKKNSTKKTTTACGSSLNSGGDDRFRHDLLEAMKALTATVKNMDTVVAEKVLAAVDTKIDEKVNARVGHVKQSWMVQDKTAYDVDATVECVVRRKANKSEVKLMSHILFDTDGEKVASFYAIFPKKKYGNLDAMLDQLAASILDGPLQKRKPQLTKTQVYPYVGNSTVKRIISADSHSKALYDPLAKVAETKFMKLLDYLQSLTDDNNVDTHFYMKLITPRNVWETYDFGWLTDSDVDRLFLCHLINGEHWITLELDLPNKVIHVYDSIQTIVPNITDLQEESRPFTKMILLLLNEMVPDRKKSSQQFKISRPKSVPRNEDPGDCGVYVLRYTECREIGCGFEGF